MVDQQLQLVTLHVDGGQGRVPATDEEATLVRGSGGGGRQDVDKVRKTKEILDAAN